MSAIIHALARFSKLIKVALFRILILKYCLIINICTASVSTHLLEQKELPSSLGSFKHSQFETDEGFIDIYAIILNNDYSSRIIKQDSMQLFAKSLSEMASNAHAIIAINGGFYDEDFSPSGLLIENGKTISTISKNFILSSCVQISNNQIILEPNAKNCLSAKNAIQTGPILIDHGQISKKLQTLKKVKMKTDFLAAHRRTIIAKTHDGKLLIIVSSPITLSLITQLLLEKPQSFGADKIKTAINLDGGRSTGMYIAFEDKPFYFSEYRNVKTLLLLDKHQETSKIRP